MMRKKKNQGGSLRVGFLDPLGQWSLCVDCAESEEPNSWGTRKHESSNEGYCMTQANETGVSLNVVLFEIEKMGVESSSHRRIIVRS